MSSLAAFLSAIVAQVFLDLGFSKDYGTVRVSDRPDLAQFQCNGALAVAKLAGKNPRVIAQQIVDNLSERIEFSHIEVAGPGFININITDSFLSEFLTRVMPELHLQTQPENDGAENFNKNNVVLDYGGPNIAKPMHVGHLRSAIIGDTLRRILLAAGYNVISDVHLGDWGTHMGTLIADYLRNKEQDIVFLHKNANNSEDVTVLMADMSERYPKAAQAAKIDASLMQEAHEATVRLQNQEEPYYEIWSIIRAVSIAGMKKNYDLLGLGEFTYWYGESDAHKYIAPMVEELKVKRLAKESDGALIIEVAQEDDKKEIPPLILYKRDGAVMYGTTDLATIVQRVRDFNPLKIIYVVDQRQSLHFEQVFRAARIAQIIPFDVELSHAGFGTMNGTDGKPFKTRAGGVMRLEDLIGLALEKAKQRLTEAKLAEDMSFAEREIVARKVAIAAIRFADLQNNRVADYIFDIDRMISFEGKTGPYLLYQVVRIRSLLRKASDMGYAYQGDIEVGILERALVLLLCEFPDHFSVAVKSYAPHVLCDYAYKLAQEFSSFYSNCHFLSESDERVRTSRLALCSLTLQQLTWLLSLLGLDAPERM